MSDNHDGVIGRVARIEQIIENNTAQLTQLNSKLDNLILLEDRSGRHEVEILELKSRIEDTEKQLAYWETFRKFAVYILSVGGSVGMFLIGWWLNRK
jgi:hypothetical protein